MARTISSVKGKDGVAGGADTLYMGARIIGRTRGRLDYSVEGVREAGGYAHDSVRAWGYIAGGGWKVSPALWNLHLSSDYAFATGDNGKKDGVHQQFDFLYGAQQPPTSLTGQLSWRNIKDWRGGADFTPVRKLTVKLDYRNYWLGDRCRRPLQLRRHAHGAQCERHQRARWRGRGNHLRLRGEQEDHHRHRRRETRARRLSGAVTQDQRLRLPVPVRRAPVLSPAIMGS